MNYENDTTMLIRLPSELKKRINDKAHDERMGMSEFIRHAIEEKISRDKYKLVELDNVLSLVKIVPEIASFRLTDDLSNDFLNKIFFEYLEKGFSETYNHFEKVEQVFWALMNSEGHKRPKPHKMFWLIIDEDMDIVISILSSHINGTSTYKSFNKYNNLIKDILIEKLGAKNV